MKHIFLIHSNTTLRVSKSYINKIEIDKNDIVFLYNEVFNGETTHKVVRYPFCYNPNGDYIHYGISNKKLLKYCLQSDFKILSSIGFEKFILYLPQSSDRAHSLLASMKSCVGYYYIEEGALAYNDKLNSCEKPLYTLPRLNNATNYIKTYAGRLNFLSSSYYDIYNKKYKGVIGFSEMAFPNFPKTKEIVEFNNLKNKIPQKNIECLLVLDPLVTYKMIELGLEIETLNWVVSKIKDKYRTIYYKFHPSQYHNTDEINLLRNIFKNTNNNDSFIEIDINESLEDIICIDKPDVCTCFSSISIYAIVLGLKVYSWSDYIITKKPEFSKYVDVMPTIFKENVIQLNKLETE